MEELLSYINRKITINETKCKTCDAFTYLTLNTELRVLYDIKEKIVNGVKTNNLVLDTTQMSIKQCQ
jgi:hypothetical protein